MNNLTYYDVIIIGGSYSGLAAAMSLGRALRKVLIIDSALPCNRQTPYSHNFITQDGEKPAAITQKARDQVLQYKTVQWQNDSAVSGIKTADGFAVSTRTGKTFKAKKLLFTTGLKDIMPAIPGIAECWGISVIHCPYCHGYEVKQQKTGIFANGKTAMHYAPLLKNLTEDLTIFTNGKPNFTVEELAKLRQHNIRINDKEIASLKHSGGRIEQLIFTDRSAIDLKALYYRPDYEQHCQIPQQLGCEFTEQNLIKTDMFQKTTIEGVFACGDNASPMRSVAAAVAAGNMAGAMLNNEMVQAAF